MAVAEGCSTWIRKQHLSGRSSYNGCDQHFDGNCFKFPLLHYTTARSKRILRALLTIARIQ
jgi:hypothetical protein